MTKKSQYGLIIQDLDIIQVALNQRHLYGLGV